MRGQITDATQAVSASLFLRGQCTVATHRCGAAHNQQGAMSLMLPRVRLRLYSCAAKCQVLPKRTMPRYTKCGQ